MSKHSKEATGKHVTIDRPDYLANHQAGQADGDVQQGTPAPDVKRFTDIELKCQNKNCPDPTFTIDFDEVQRSISCPTCGVEVFIPQQYWGTP